MDLKTILINFLKGKHSIGQMLNLFKYFVGNKDKKVNWDPLFISAFPTYDCNFSCDMCLSHSKKFNSPWGQKSTKEMEFELFKKIIDRYNNSLEVNLIGNGESLFNKELFKMIEYASDSGMYVNSGSNGMLLDDKMIEKVLNSKLDKFTISINGHNKAEFSRMTGMPGETFDIICDNTKKLVKFRDLNNSKLTIITSIILDKNNYQHIIPMINFLQGLGADEIYFFQFLPSNNTGFKPNERCLFSNDLKVIEKFHEAKSYAVKKNIIVSFPPLIPPNKRDNKLCNVPFFNLAVDGEGNVGGCSCQLLNFSDNGKFQESSDPWNNQYFQDFREIFLDDETPLLWPCQYCYNNTTDLSVLSNPNPIGFIVHKYLKLFSK